MTEEHEDKGGSEEGELTDVSDENLQTITAKGRTASGNLEEGGRCGFPGDANSQQIDNDIKMAISISSDEGDASPSKNKTKKLRKACVHD